MLTPNELRVGNLVTKKDQIFVADFITIQMAHNYEAIPLTPEILEKCGFEKKEWDQFSENMNKLLEEKATGYVLTNNDVYCFICNYGFPGSFGRRNTRSWKEGLDIWNFTEYGRPKYLHQLQNLYFAIRETELTIKEISTCLR